MSDWEARPLSPAQAAYAALDAHALVRIYDAIAAQLGRNALLALCRGRSGALADGSGSAGRGGGDDTNLATHSGRATVSPAGVDEGTACLEAGSPSGGMGGGDGTAGAHAGIGHGMVPLPARWCAAGTAHGSNMRAAGAGGASTPTLRSGAPLGRPWNPAMSLRACERAWATMRRTRGFGCAACCASLALPCGGIL